MGVVGDRITSVALPRWSREPRRVGRCWVWTLPPRALPFILPPFRVVVKSLSGPLDPLVRSAVGFSHQVCRGTRLLGRTWLMGPARQASVGTRLWDLDVGPAHQVGYGIHPLDLPWDPPTRSNLADGTRSSGQCWDPPMGPARGTHC
jgi:hypothetical protein